MVVDFWYFVGQAIEEDAMLIWSETVDDFGEEVIICCQCHCELRGNDRAFPVSEGEVCETCSPKYEASLTQKAERFALENCKILLPLPEYDDENEYRCTPEEYDAGIRDSNTPNAYFTMCRHEYTNYDELIRPYPKNSDDLTDIMYYDAIQTQIYRLLIEEIERNHLICPQKLDRRYEGSGWVSKVAMGRWSGGEGWSVAEVFSGTEVVHCEANSAGVSPPRELCGRL